MRWLRDARFTIIYTLIALLALALASGAPFNWGP
jgi:hypothetical protein